MLLDKNASSSEFGKKDDTFIVDLMSEWKQKGDVVQKRSKDSDLGGTLRLGSYVNVLKENSLARKFIS